MRSQGLEILADADALARAAAAEFASRAREAIAERGVFRVALAGGRTPRTLYRLLAGDPAYRDGIAWCRAHLFTGDERRVPPDHAESNFRLIHETLYAKLPPPAGRIWRFCAEADDVAWVADHFEQMTRRIFQTPPGEVPRFDLVLLGLGADGHTASLFPGSPALDEQERLAAAPWVPQLGVHRFTLTPRAINHAAAVMFLVSGEDKAPALRDALETEPDPARRPTQAVRPASGAPLWLVDRAAASLLTSAG